MIPSKEENPTGFHQRYYVRNLYGNTDPRAEFFVLRLDEHGKNPKWRRACLKALETLVTEIQDDLPGIAGDLTERYLSNTEQLG